MTLRLSESTTEALRRKAAAEGRSMQQVASEAIEHYVTDRPARLTALIDEGLEQHKELLDRLAR
jgi:predicted transcriptional regulator